MISRQQRLLLAVFAILLCLPLAAAEPGNSGAANSTVKNVLVLAGVSPANQEITGSYDKETPGFAGGMNAGASIGRGVVTQIGGVSVAFPVPILTIPGAIFGGLSGKAKKEIQDFRDAMTRDLARDENQPLTHDAIAMDVFWMLKEVPGLESRIQAHGTAIPADTDAVLYVHVSNVTIDIEKTEAIITTTATATLRRTSDGFDLFDKSLQYQDRDSLANWTHDDNALWHDYANFARHYLSREFAAELFADEKISQRLQPSHSDTIKPIKKSSWQGRTKKLSPVLAWEPAPDSRHQELVYELEIYDAHRLVYAVSDIRDTQHQVTGLQDCTTYRWSVRPSSIEAGTKKPGNWMRYSSEASKPSANIGRKVSVAPAYTQDFASLEVKCGST